MSSHCSQQYAIFRFAAKLGVDSKLEGWGDDELAGLNLEAATALEIPSTSAARLVSFIR